MNDVTARPCSATCSDHPSSCNPRDEDEFRPERHRSRNIKENARISPATLNFHDFLFLSIN